jgi:tripartite-type tricarboxylate transporter receptor subunit TctC
MPYHHLRVAALAAVPLAIALPPVPQASAQGAEPYAGKTITMIVPFSTGGYYDTGGRLIARHLGKQIPGKPAIVVQNQPSAGGIGLANRLAHGSDKEGLTIGALQRAIPQVALMGDPAVKYDPLKLTWFGSLSGYATDSYLMFINTTHKVRTVDDLRTGGMKAVFGAGRSGSTNLMLALVARDVLKLNIDVVRGFPGTNDITLAQLRGEVDAQIADLSVLKAGMGDVWATRKVRGLVQFARTNRLPELADVPTARELATSDDDRAVLAFAELPFFMALPLAGSADMPPDRARIISTSFMAMKDDPEFQADANKMGYPTDLVPGERVKALIEEAARTPKDVIERYKRIVNQEK